MKILMKCVFYSYLFILLVFQDSFFAEDFSSVSMDAYFNYINDKRRGVFEDVNKALFKVIINLERAEKNVKCSELFDPWFCKEYCNKEYVAQIEKRIEALAVAIDVQNNTGAAFFAIFAPLAELNKDIDVVIDDFTCNCFFVGYDDTTGVSLYKVSTDQVDAFYKKVKPLRLAREFKSGEYTFVDMRECPCKKEERIYVKDLGYTNTACDCSSDFLSFFFNQGGELVGVSTNNPMFKDFYIRRLDYNMSQGPSTSEIYGVIPVNEIKNAVFALLNNGIVKHSCGGLTLFSVNKRLSEERGLKVDYGCYVDAVAFGSDFVIKPGDVIVSMNGYDVHDFNAFCSVFRKCKNDDLRITLYRGAERIDDVIIDAGVNADVTFVYEKGKKLIIEGITFVERSTNDGKKSAVIISHVENEQLKNPFGWKNRNNFVIKSVNNMFVSSLKELKDVLLAGFNDLSREEASSIPLVLIGSFDSKGSNEKIFSLLLAKRK